MTGKPFPDNTLYYAPGNPHFLSELGRVVVATVTGQESWQNVGSFFANDHFNVLYCHSNGCTEAERMIKHHCITADTLIQMGTPWGSATPTFMPQTVTATFTNYGDPIPILGIIRIFHSPFVEFPKSRRERKLRSDGVLKDDFARKTADIVVKPEGHAFLPHPATLYFDAITRWVCEQYNLQGIVESRCVKPGKPIEMNFGWFHCYFGNPDVGCVTVRQELPELVLGGKQETDLVIQPGQRDCSQVSNVRDTPRDCRGNHFYVNYRYADFSFEGLGMESAEAAESCGSAVLKLLDGGAVHSTFKRLAQRCTRDGQLHEVQPVAKTN
jgi:hypothetical protein